MRDKQSELVKLVGEQTSVRTRFGPATPEERLFVVALKGAVQPFFYRFQWR